MSVKIFFGPYEAHGIIRHKTQRLYGIMSRLSQLGYEIELVPTNYLNVLTIEMRNKQVFRCAIKNLRFNMDIEDDPVGLKAIEAVEEAKERYYSDDNMPNFAQQRRVRGAISFTDALSYDIEVIYEIPYWDGLKKKRMSIESG